MNKKKAAANSSTEKKELKIVLNDVSRQYFPNPHCCAMLVQVMPDWVPPFLNFKMVDALKGHSKGMASLMTDNLIAFLSGGGRFLTGIQNVDDQLLQLYREIYDYAHDHGYKLDALF